MTDDFKLELEHQPTRESYEWLKKLVERFALTRWDNDADRKIFMLEIGSAWGVSAKAFLESPYVMRLVSVDKNDCPRAVAEVADLKAEGRWHFIKGDSRDVLPRLRDNAKYDIILVDGAHDSDTASKDINNAWEILNPGGIIIVDDVLHKCNFENGTKDDWGVARALWGFIHHKQIIAEFIPSWTGYGVIHKPL